MGNSYQHDWINHDVSHCLDYDPNKCPDWCFRAQVTEDLNDRHDLVGIPMSWMHFRQTSECGLNKTNQQETVKEYPMFMAFPKLKQTVTNGDRIRAMTDEELVKAMLDGVCNLVPAETCLVGKKDCEQCCLDWLKQEAADD